MRGEINFDDGMKLHSQSYPPVKLNLKSPHIFMAKIWYKFTFCAADSALRHGLHGVESASIMMSSVFNDGVYQLVIPIERCLTSVAIIN